MLYAKLVLDWAHDGLGPFTEGQSVAEPVVQVNKALILCSCFISVDYDALLGNEVEGALCIKEEKEQRLLEGEEGEVQGFREEEGGKLVAGA